MALMLLAGSVCAAGAVGSTYAAWRYRRSRMAALAAAAVLLVASAWFGAIPWGIGRSVMLVALLVSIFAASGLVLLAEHKPRKALIVRVSRDVQGERRWRVATRWLLAGPFGFLIAIVWSGPLLLWPDLAPATRIAVALLAITTGWAVAASLTLASIRPVRCAAWLIGSALVAVAICAGLMMT